MFNGGVTNLYGYVLNDPINFIDPSGLLFGWNAGESHADYAAQYWANESENQCNSDSYRTFATGAGMMASLWSTGASETTAITLATGFAAAKIAPLVNANRYLRIGVGSKGGERVFRASGRIVQWLERKGVPGIRNGHIDFINLGPK